ncbi:guanylate kinase [Linnemannia gamsii]|uniref:guanylate kinase n=1 Tax=Linnemannia gamsii TaxID=64522 RepID=A0ABQ7K694_9FUNG|nr:guanylate kinase [Linnemannia gamsii]
MPTAAPSRPIVISGPSGAGKSTFLKRLFAEYPDKFGFSVSNTTRKPRAGEVDGVDYNFLTREDFLAGVARGDFIEHAEFSGNLYGTTVQGVKSVGDKGRICILDIDMQGVKLVKKTDLNPYYLSVQPPSIEELEKRLRGRGTEKEADIQGRLSAAQGELDYAKEEGAYDEIIVNDDLEAAYAKFKAYIDKVTSA